MKISFIVMSLFVSSYLLAQQKTPVEQVISNILRGDANLSDSLLIALTTSKNTTYEHFYLKGINHLITNDTSKAISAFKNAIDYKLRKPKATSDSLLNVIMLQEPKNHSGELSHDFALSYEFYALQHAVWLYLNNQKNKSCEEFILMDEKKIFNISELKKSVCE